MTMQNTEYIRTNQPERCKLCGKPITRGHWYTIEETGAAVCSISCAKKIIEGAE